MLVLDPVMGMSGDMFAAALIGLGAPEKGVVGALRAAGDDLGLLDAHTHLDFLPDGTLGYRLHVVVLEERPPLLLTEARRYLARSLARVGVAGEYAAFAHRALEILSAAERYVHATLPPPPPAREVSLPVVGTAHTPYQHRAPYQPSPEEAERDAFYIEVEPQYAPGLAALETFSHIFVISYLDRSQGFAVQLHPPWKDGDEQYGVFATRSPNRPSPLGLTRVRLLRVEGNRVYTGPLDLFDGTPVLDLKPFIRSLDGAEGESGNDGWLAGSEHLELHRRGIPHTHPGRAGRLHEAQDIVADLTAAAWGLQSLGAPLGEVVCLAPVAVGGGTVFTSHGRLPVPAPATQFILDEHHIPYAPGPEEVELLTPTGAAILAALSPTFAPREETSPPETDRVGVGLGQRVFDERPNALWLYLTDEEE